MSVYYGEHKNFILTYYMRIQRSEIQLVARPPLGSQLAKPVEAIFVIPKKGQVTLAMHKIFNLLLARAHEEGVDKDVFRIALSRLGTDLGTESKNVEFLKDAARKLMATVVEWNAHNADGSKRWGASTMLASVQIESGNGGIVEFAFSPHIKEKLLRPEIYARLNLQLQNKFRSRHGLALFEQCARYKDNPSRMTTKLPWQTWAEMMSSSAGESNYVREWKYFARDLLKPAIKEINLVSEEFTIEALITKSGRRVETLQFKLCPKSQTSLPLPSQDYLTNPALRARVEKLGLSGRQLIQIFSEFDETSIQATLDYVEKRLRNPKVAPVENVGAYFLNALHKRYAQPEAPVTLPPTNQRIGQGAEDLLALRSAFLRERLLTAEAMYDEQTETEQTNTFEQYLMTLPSASLRSRFEKYGPKGKTTKGSFFEWLANTTWGEPTEQDFKGRVAKVQPIQLNKI